MLLVPRSWRQVFIESRPFRAAHTFRPLMVPSVQFGPLVWRQAFNALNHLPHPLQIRILLLFT